jgi:hypothetical protein
VHDVTGDWLPVLGTLVPLAVVVALSPLSIIPAVLLVLHTARPKSTGLGFVVGWLSGLVAITAVFVVVPRLFSGLDRPVPPWASWVRIGVGIVLIALGGWRWATRKSAAPRSAWSTSIAKVSPVGAIGLGFGLTVINPKVLLASAAAGLAIGTADLSRALTWLSVAFYAVLAGSTAIAPIVAYVFVAERIDDQLGRIKSWIERQQAAITAVILLLIGFVLVFTGARAL